jgi:probable blue pigment (indigoidine) exporter
MSRLLLTAVAPVLWGTTYLVTTQFLPPDQPLTAGLLRALPAGLLLVAITRTLPRGTWWWRAAVLGTLNIGAFFPLLFLSAYRLPGGVAALLGGAQPLIVAGLTVGALRQRVSCRQIAAAFVALAGVSLVVLRAGAHLDTIGVVAGLGGAAAMAGGVVLTRAWGRPPGVGDLAFTGWQLTAGGLVILPIAVFAEGLPTVPTWSALGGYLWLGLLNTALGYLLWFGGLRSLQAIQVSLLGTLSPVTAALLGWLALDQTLSPLQLLGMAVALTGIVAGQLAARPAPVRPVLEDRALVGQGVRVRG